MGQNESTDARPRQACDLGLASQTPRGVPSHRDVRAKTEGEEMEAEGIKLSLCRLQDELAVVCALVPVYLSTYLLVYMCVCACSHFYV